MNIYSFPSLCRLSARKSCKQGMLLCILHDSQSFPFLEKTGQLTIQYDLLDNQEAIEVSLPLQYFHF